MGERERERERERKKRNSPIGIAKGSEWKKNNALSHSISLFFLFTLYKYANFVFLPLLRPANWQLMIICFCHFSHQRSRTKRKNNKFIANFFFLFFSIWDGERSTTSSSFYQESIRTMLKTLSKMISKKQFFFCYRGNICLSFLSFYFLLFLFLLYFKLNFLLR